MFFVVLKNDSFLDSVRCLSQSIFQRRGKCGNVDLHVCFYTFPVPARQIHCWSIILIELFVRIWLTILYYRFYRSSVCTNHICMGKILYYSLTTFQRNYEMYFHQGPSIKQIQQNKLHDAVTYQFSFITLKRKYLE